MAAPTLKELKQLVAHLEGLRSKRLAQQWEIGKLILPSRGLFQGEEQIQRIRFRRNDE